MWGCPKAFPYALKDLLRFRVGFRRVRGSFAFPRWGRCRGKAVTDEVLSRCVSRLCPNRCCLSVKDLIRLLRRHLPHRGRLLESASPRLIPLYAAIQSRGSFTGSMPLDSGTGPGRSPNPKVWGLGLPLHPPPPGVSGFLPVTRSAVINVVTRWARGTRGAWRDRACRGRGLPCFSCCPSTAPVFVGRGRGRDGFETMAEMMVHDHFRRWCAAGGCSYARKEASRAVPPLPRSAGFAEGSAGERLAGSRVPGAALLHPAGRGKRAVGVGADAPGRGVMGGKDRPSGVHGSGNVTSCCNTLLTFYHGTAGPNYAQTPSR